MTPCRCTLGSVEGDCWGVLGPACASLVVVTTGGEVGNSRHTATPSRRAPGRFRSSASRVPVHWCTLDGATGDGGVRGDLWEALPPEKACRVLASPTETVRHSIHQHNSLGAGRHPTVLGYGHRGSPCVCVFLLTQLLMAGRGSSKAEQDRKIISTGRIHRYGRVFRQVPQQRAAAP